jgi:hypothetical protein
MVEQNTVLLVAIPNILSAQANKIHCLFVTQNHVPRGRTSQYELLLSTNSKDFRCTAEQRTVI